MSMSLSFTINCVPPSTTAQMKRRSRSGHYYQPVKMQRLEQTWAALLRPHVPLSPVTGAVELTVRLVYPHLKATPQATRGSLIPKVSRPDADNAAKHLIDLLARMRFMDNDAHVSRLIVEKFHGPEAHVGIQIAICPLLPSPITQGAPEAMSVKPTTRTTSGRKPRQAVN